jgi:hypothetical protein
MLCKYFVKLHFLGNNDKKKAHTCLTNPIHLCLTAQYTGEMNDDQTVSAGDTEGLSGEESCRVVSHITPSMWIQWSALCSENLGFDACEFLDFS